MHLGSTSDFHFDELEAEKHPRRLDHELGNEPLIVELHKYISFIISIIRNMELKEFTATFKMSVLLPATVNSNDFFSAVNYKLNGSITPE